MNGDSLGLTHQLSEVLDVQVEKVIKDWVLRVPEPWVTDRHKPSLLLRSPICFFAWFSEIQLKCRRSFPTLFHFAVLRRSWARSNTYRQRPWSWRTEHKSSFFDLCHELSRMFPRSGKFPPDVVPTPHQVLFNKGSASDPVTIKSSQGPQWHRNTQSNIGNTI